MAAARAAGEDIEPHEVSRKVLHRLVSFTNRRLHKGPPQMLTYLLGKKMEYGSHSFCSILIDLRLRQAVAVLHQVVSAVPAPEPPTA